MGDTKKEAPGAISFKVLPMPKGIKKCLLHENDKEEMGRIHFRYTGEFFEEAKREAKDFDMPILMIFQEMPGTKECINFGRNVLSHPLLVEAAETLFIPLIINSTAISGGDSAVMAKYREQRHFSPVVRIVTCTGKDLILRISNEDCNLGNVARSMVKALQRTKAKVPKYLKLLAVESRARCRLPGAGYPTIRSAFFGVSNTSEGEVDLAGAHGIISTNVITLGSHKRVVHVQYDFDHGKYRDIVKHALATHNILKIFYVNEGERFSAEEEIKSSEEGSVSLVELLAKHKIRSNHRTKANLLFSGLQNVPLTPMQATRANQALSHPMGEEKAHNLLSPRQLAILEATEIKTPRRHVIGVPVEQAWEVLAQQGTFNWSI